MLSQWNTYSQIIEFVQKDTTLQKQVKETAELYIDKVLPPSERYYLELFDTCEKKKNFIEDTNENGENKNIEQFISEQITKLYRRVYGNKSNVDNFLYYKNGTKKIFCLPYLLFMGKTSRQLINQCLILKEMADGVISVYDTFNIMKRKNKTEAFKYLHREVYRQVQHFLYNSINSGDFFRIDDCNTSQLVEKILLFQKEESPIYINYQYILEYYKLAYEKSNGNEKRVSNLKNAVALYVLAFFAENILLIGDKCGQRGYAINPQRERIHGIDGLIELFDMVTFSNNVSLLKRSDSKENTSNLQKIMYLFENVIICPESTIEFRISDFSSVREYLYGLLSKDVPETISTNMLENWSHRNPVWFKTVSKILYLYVEGIYTMKKMDLNKLDLNEDKIGQDVFSQRWIKNINLNNGAHLLEVILMLGSDNDFISRRLQNIVNILSESDEGRKNAVKEFSSKYMEGKDRNTYITVEDLEKRFEEAIKFQDANGTKEKDIIAAMGMRKFFGDANIKKQMDEIIPILKGERETTILRNNENIKKWLIMLIYELEEKIYDAMRKSTNYTAHVKAENIDDFKKGLLELRNLAQTDTQDYKKILDIFEKVKVDGSKYMLDNQTLVRLYQQIKRTKKQLLCTDTEEGSASNLGELDSLKATLDKNLILMSDTPEKYIWLENYVFLLYTLRYFMNLFFAITFQEQKDAVAKKINSRDSFGSKIYEMLMTSVKSAVTKNAAEGREEYALYYMGNLLRTYFIEAGDEYIQQWRHDLNE